ncbi:hypothetical protein HYH03_003136 [Edaphochlamys debaryana]|uniref:Signal peptidase complex subunit 2 n=1 Tax=Edaphochlamys debaryana TaxID=47281 RepID=A0A835YAC2_9CHLO|nr:hypothetical protein HYH03_003136 [Edaphochlamys debaryana]|eukprot:KAG2498946.1 hypothetical protein HYH03_003136 [Edaphochlamys debaryana]
MAKGKPSKPPKAAAEREASPGPQDEDHKPLKLSNLYEGGALKAALDDVAREAVLDQGYQEDVMIQNIKIGLGLLAIGAAVFSHFGPGKFPANWWQVFACVVTYVVLTIAMNVYSMRVEGDAFLVTKPFRGTKGVRLSSAMHRFSEDYTLAITDKEDPSLEVQSTYKVPKYFHEDGYMAEGAWKEEVDKLAASLAALRTERTGKKND